MKQITVSAPGKLMLLGEHAVVSNRPCLVTAVDQRMFASVQITDKFFFELNAPDVKISNYKKPLDQIGKGDIPKEVKFVEIAVKNVLDAGFKIPFSAEATGGKQDLRKIGLNITTKSEFSSQFGFGSSSAVTVCIIKALSELFDLHLSEKQIFDIACKAVLDIQGKGSGFDIAAAVYGGTLYFLTDGKVIEQLYSSSGQSESRSINKNSSRTRFAKASPGEQARAINSLPLVVGYSGVKADTVILMKQAKEKFAQNPQKLDTIYNAIEALVENAKENLLKKDWESFGGCMNQNQTYLQELGVSTSMLNAMIKAANEAGVYGAKLSGAGGGDCMIAICETVKRKKVEQKIAAVGGKIIHISPNAQGVRIEL